jgi:LVIVD repeat
VATLTTALLLVGLLSTGATAQDADPRIGLDPGYLDAEQVEHNIDHLANRPRSGPFDSPPGDFAFINSDLAFTGDHAIAGNFNGFQIYDVSDPADPTLTGSFVCPGGQGDVSVYGDLLFMSVEETRARIDCGTQGAPGAVNPERFRGVRVFDISDINNPRQLTGVQTCRGSHTHTVVADPDDDENIYIYNSGTAGVRPPEELAGCKNVALTKEPVRDPEATQWRIDIIRVPLDSPEDAEIVSQPRIFTDPDTGAFNGLQNTLPGELHPSGTPYSPLPNTNTCHDITAYPALGVAAGACQGNGILLDITDPVNPVRLDAVSDPNFSYWHSATLSNDGTKVVFTDEWGGGTQPRCRETDRPEWGADAIYDISDGEMEFASYYKLPVPQTVNENCVAHNGSLVPVPGRDIMVQAWYQGGLSMFDFTDSENPTEIAFFDRGPVSGEQLVLAGLWSTYWYNGNVYGTEISRGFDSFGLVESDQMSSDEIAAASQVRLDEFNAQMQTPFTWEPSFEVAGALLDQLERSGDVSAKRLRAIRALFDNARRIADRRPRAASVLLEGAAALLGRRGLEGDARDALRDLARTLR